MADAGRVIAGTARGVRLAAPTRTGTRPLGDRVKQTLFAILESAALGPWPVSFLDLFAGSGAAGIEALSRGAPAVVFVERDEAAIRVIGENLRRARAAIGDATPGRTTIVPADVASFLARDPPALGAPFGAVLIDPPYADRGLEQLLGRLADGATGSRWLTDDAVVVAKHFWRTVVPEEIGQFRRARERRFGETQLTFYAAATRRGY